MAEKNQISPKKPAVQKTANKAVVYDANGKKFAVILTDRSTVYLRFHNVNVLMTPELANALCEALKK